MILEGKKNSAHSPLVAERAVHGNVLRRRMDAGMRDKTARTVGTQRSVVAFASCALHRHEERPGVAKRVEEHSTPPGAGTGVVRVLWRCHPSSVPLPGRSMAALGRLVDNCYCCTAMKEASSPIRTQA